MAHEEYLSTRFYCTKWWSNRNSPRPLIFRTCRTANYQGASVAFIYLGNPLIEQRDVKRALIAALQTDWNSNIKEVWLLYRDLTILELSRSEIQDRSFIGKLK